MICKSKITFISFQNINYNKPTGMVKFLLPLIEKFNQSKIDTYFISSLHGYLGNLNIKEVSLTYKILTKCISIFRRLFRNVSYGKIRLLQEVLFDFFVSLRVSKPTILVSTSYLKKSTKKNTKLGGINIFISGNPDDREIYKIMEAEQKKYNVKVFDAYTYKKRIEFIGECLNTYDHVITFTQSEYETFSINFHQDMLSYKEAFIVPNKNTFKEININKNDALTFCYIAHTVWLKGLIYLIVAFNQIENKNIKLIIGGSINSQVKETIAKIGINKNIQLIGHVPNLNHFIRSSHVCIVPSLLDAGPATVAEALYCGLPVITTEGCGSKTLIKDGENGFIVPIADADAIANKIQWFVDNKDKIEKMGENAKKSIEDIEKSDQNEILANHIMEVIEKLKKEKGVE